AVRVRGQLEGRPLAERRRLRPQIHNDVIQSAPDTAHQLGLAMRRMLEMQAAQGPGSRIEGDAVLGEIRHQAQLCKRRLAPGPRKEPALIGVLLDIDEIDARQAGLAEYHAARQYSPSSTCLVLRSSRSCFRRVNGGALNTASVMPIVWNTLSSCSAPLR